MWTRVSRFRTGYNGELLWTRLWTSESHTGYFINLFGLLTMCQEGSNRNISSTRTDHSCCARSPTWLLSLRLLNNKFLISKMCVTFPANLNLIIILIEEFEEYKFWSILLGLCNFFGLMLLRSKYFPQLSVLKHLQLSVLNRIVCTFLIPDHTQSQSYR